MVGPTQSRAKHAARTVAVRTRTYHLAKAAVDARWRRQRQRLGSYSQFGEDRVVLDLLGPSGRYLDIGANHPFKSNSTYLLHQVGWRGLIVEPIRSHTDHHRRVRPGDVCVTAAAGRSTGSGRFHELNPSGFSTFDADAARQLCADQRAIAVGSYDVPIVRASDLWAEHFPATPVDFVAIDTEGFELDVLAGIDFDHLRPALVLVEFERPNAPSHATEIVDAMSAVGYSLHSSYGVNGLFQRR